MSKNTSTVVAKTLFSVDGRGEPMKRAFRVAKSAATRYGKATGWIRLASVLSMDADRSQDGTKYVLACREVNDGTKIQFSCSCPDYIYRKQQTGSLCKHQVSFLTQTPVRGFERWYYRAGLAFLQALANPNRDGGEEEFVIDEQTK